MDNQRLSLAHFPWQVVQAPPLSLSAPLDDPRSLEGWLPARVPGSIFRDLMAAGRLPDLYQVEDVEQVLRPYEGMDWWYHTRLPAIAGDQRAWLDFGGIDYFAAVVMNGQELERRAGMFSPRRYEVTSFLREAPGQLHVRIWGAWALPTWPRTWRYRLMRWLASRVQTNLPPFHDRLLTLKAPVHFGWDFAPRVMNVGIWDDGYLHVAGPVAVRGMWARADWGEEYGITVRLELDAASPMPVTARLTLHPLTSNEAVQEAVFHFRIPSPHWTRTLVWPDAVLKPWTTHDRGVPHRYRLEVTLWDDAGRLLDRREQVIGRRAFGWQVKDGVYYPRLNQQPLRFRGANWVPLDMLPGDPDEEVRYRALLQQAVDAGVNALRVWGGGGRERPIFYDLCDELGLLVWQEMPISCVFLDRLPQDDAFLRLVQQETRGIIRTLRHHPSIFMWGGGNEWGPGRFKRVARAMSQVAYQEDPSRRWLPASPGPHDSHNWQVWHGFASPHAYTRDPAPLLSEFGLAAPPAIQVLRRMLPAEGLWPPGPAWERRKAELAKLIHYAHYIRARWDGPEALVEAAQEAQARGLQQGVEHYRLREDAVGTFLWQWNEPWPGISWSVQPYWGEAKRAWAQVARSYGVLAPLARFTQSAVEVWVVNDGLGQVSDCTLEVLLDGERWWMGRVHVQPHGRALVHRLPHPPRPGLLTLRLHCPDGERVNDYPWPWPFPRGARLSLRAWLEKRVMAWLLRW